MKHFMGSRVLPSLLYHRPKNMQEALRMLNELQPECKIIAGCTDLIPAIRRGAWTFGEDLNVIDITQIKEMISISKDKETIKIGAATRLSQIVDSQMI
ncbi:MAG TPA: FAD binding domain-containing protein, partial [Desulfatiglandales bacterium]|nr:FAD binding domain-containing protein [Desulfatiglandales bacterium]